MIFAADIEIMPLTELLDPQGKAVSENLQRLGLSELSNVRIGKHITLNVAADNEEKAHELVDNACKKLLTNQVMEQYTIKLKAN